MIPVTALVMTKNEQDNIQACLHALQEFAEIIVVDSNSTDQTKILAKQSGAHVIDFTWNNSYPKKRQWCLDHITMKHDWVFFVDADEIVPKQVTLEIACLFEPHGNTHPPTGIAGYFIQSDYYIDGQVTRFGLKNTKLVLFDKTCITFPVVNDLDCPGMGEIEGHYQPVLKDNALRTRIGILKSRMIHHISLKDGPGHQTWIEKHKRYAQWFHCVERKNALPKDPSTFRRILKTAFLSIPFRPHTAFLHSYVLKFGFLDGVTGFRLAKSRFTYYEFCRQAANTPCDKSTLPESEQNPNP